MERLPGIDASFLYMETPTLHMHTIKVALLEPAPGVDYSIARVKRDLRARLHLLPPFRRRIVEVPLGFHHPVWIEDPAFDLDYHVRRTTVPAPGGPREMDAVISEIASTPLDRRRPLWEIWFLEGLAGGRVAAVGKIHHTVADGVAVAGLLANVMTPGLEDLADIGAEDAWRGEPIPSAGALLRDALRDHGRQLTRLPGLVARTVHNLAAVARRRRRPGLVPPRPVFDAPRTSLNGSLTARRAFASTALPLDDVRRVRAAFGVTLNDVLLAVVAGTLRVHLAARGERPRGSLVAEVPVATDAPGAPRLRGNHLSNIFTSLCTDVDDPVTRLRGIHDVMAAAKEFHELLGSDLFESWIQYAPPKLTAGWMRLYAGLHLVDRHRPPVNVIVSCVPGPRSQLAWSGGTLEAIYSVGPIIEGTALNVTAWTYVDRLCVGTLTCPDLLPDPHAIALGLHDALAELVAVAEAVPVVDRRVAPM
jgi:WS/DGAT/MGAT family acyltransferase